MSVSIQTQVGFTEREIYQEYTSMDTVCRNHFRFWDHLRSNLGIICGTGIICWPGSFEGPYRSKANPYTEDF